jgi:hypothetical protein
VRRKLSQFFAPKRKLPAPVGLIAPPKPVTPLSKPAPLTTDESSAWLATVNFDTEFRKGMRGTHRSIAAMELDTQALIKELIDHKGVSTRQVVPLMSAIEAHIAVNQRYTLTHDIMLVAGELQHQGRLVDVDYGALLIALRNVNVKLTGKKLPGRISSQEELDGKTALTHAFSKWRVRHVTDAANYKLNSDLLTEFVYDHPEELDRVLTYVDERGMDDDNDFYGLMASLEAPASAVQEGWL